MHTHIILLRSFITFLGIVSCLSYSLGQDALQMKIGLIADPQYADVPNHNSRHYRASIQKLSDAIDSLNLHQIDFVQNLGDIIDRDWDSFDSILPCYESLDPQISNYHLLGNHDYSIDSVHKPLVLEKLSMPDFYYSYVKGTWRFIVLDATDLAYFSNAAHQHKIGKIDRAYRKVEGQANHQLWNSGIGKKQLKWLRSELKAATKESQQVIVFSHLPVWPIGATHNLWNDADIVKLMEKHDNVFAFINGHNHAGDYTQHNGIHYLTLCGMVETDINSFGILEIYADTCRLVGFGSQSTLFLR